MKLENIIFEKGKFFVIKTAKGFEVYENGPTAAVRCATIDYPGEKGLQRAKQEIEHRTPVDAVQEQYELSWYSKRGIQ